MWLLFLPHLLLLLLLSSASLSSCSSPSFLLVFVLFAHFLSFSPYFPLLFLIIVPLLLLSFLFPFVFWTNVSIRGLDASGQQLETLCVPVTDPGGFTLLELWD